MKITDEMAGVIERNAGEVKLTENEDGSISVTIKFEPDLETKSDDGKIFIDEMKKIIYENAMQEMEEDYE
jgi:hypothetical protein